MAWWNGAGTRKMRTPLGVRGKVWNGLRVSPHEKLQGDFSDSVTAIQDGDGGEVKGPETVVRQNTKGIIA